MNNEYFAQEHKTDLENDLEGLSVEELAELSPSPEDISIEIDLLRRDIDFFESHYGFDPNQEDGIDLYAKLEELKNEKIKNLTDSYEQAIKESSDIKQEHIDQSKAIVEKSITQIEEDFSRYMKTRNKFIELSRQNNK